MIRSQTPLIADGKLLSERDFLVVDILVMKIVLAMYANDDGMVRSGLRIGVRGFECTL